MDLITTLVAFPETTVYKAEFSILSYSEVRYNSSTTSLVILTTVNISIDLKYLSIIVLMARPGVLNNWYPAINCIKEGL